MMRVLSVRQPWAHAIVHGWKDVENRTRNLAGAYRGPVAIHAAVRTDINAFALGSDGPRAELNRMADAWDVTGFVAPWWQQVGVILGVVELVDVHHTGPFEGECWHDDGVTDWCSPWAEMGAHHLVLANPRPLTEPMPWKGALGLRELPADVEVEILRRLS